MKAIKENWKLVLIMAAGIIAVIFMCIFGVQGAQNKAFAMEEQVNTADSDIKVQEKRRVDLVYNLADCVKQYDKHANSCSTMHKIQAKEFTMDDFSCEHLDIRTEALLEEAIKALNDYRKLYIEYNADDFEIKGCPSKKDIWWQMIQLLPSSYNQTRNVMMNYEVMANIYKSRRGHKLDEWCDFCKWIETLPYSEIIMSSSGLDLNSINALQGAARNSSKGYIYKRKTED